MGTAPSNSFLLKRLHSLTGVIPIGYYLVQHLVLNFSSQIDRGNAFNRVIAGFESLPRVALLCIEISILAIPILYHSAYGFYVTLGGRPEPVRYGYLRNWTYLGQRVSGILVFLFIGIHVWQMTLHPKLTHRELNFALVSQVVTNPIWTAAYVIGVLAAVFHLANGLCSFCVTWGITIGAGSQRVAAWGFGLFGLALFLIGMAALQGFFANAQFQVGAAQATLPPVR